MDKDRAWRVVTLLRKGMEVLPHRLAIRVGGGLGHLFRVFSGKRVAAAERRCARALDVDAGEARAVVRASYSNMGRSVAEVIHFSKSRRRLASFITVHGEENLRDAYERGKGVILLSAHLGNWELGAAVLAERGYPMNAIGADQRDERITNLIMEKREALGVRTVSKGFDLKSAIRCLRRGEVLAILIDQDVKDKGVMAPFLGIPASTPYGPAKIAMKYGSVILPSFMIRRGTSPYHDLHLLPSLWPDGYPGPEETMEEAMTLCNEALSEWIRKYPGQWMWMARRWPRTVEDEHDPRH